MSIIINPVFTLWCTLLLMYVANAAGDYAAAATAAAPAARSMRLGSEDGSGKGRAGGGRGTAASAPSSAASALAAALVPASPAQAFLGFGGASKDDQYATDTVSK